MINQLAWLEATGERLEIKAGEETASLGYWGKRGGGTG